MKYNIDLNDNDYIEFNYSYLKHSKIGKYSLLATRISFPIAMSAWSVIRSRAGSI